MKLQILIPQWHESDAEIKPLLDSIAIQQNVDLGDIGVIICNDGSKVFLSDELLKSYPFAVEYYKCEHKGVSATRNSCLDHATADYVMFCDVDDMFFNACGLFLVFDEIKNSDFDTLTSAFIEESRIDGKPVYINHTVDSTFVHGKVHKREYLLRENIRWNESLTVHEDSYFNILCQRLTKKSRYCPTSFYLWKWRDDSVCRHDPKYILRTYNDMLDSNTALVSEFLRRGRDVDARYFCAMMVFDAYFTLNKAEWISGENDKYRNAVEKRFGQYWVQFSNLFFSVGEDVKTDIVTCLKNRFFGEGLLLESITFDDWISKISETGGFGIDS